MSYADREASTYGGAPYECYWFTCGATSWRFTSGDAARVIAGQTFQPAAIDRSEIDQNDELRAGQLRVVLPLDNPIAQLHVGPPPDHPVDLVLYRGHDGEPETVAPFTGRVAHASFDDVACELTLITERAALEAQVPGLLYQQTCPRVPYSPGCGVDRTAYAVPGTLASVSGRTLQVPEASAHADGYFNGGWVEGGGTSRLVLRHVGSALELSIVPPAGWGAGLHVAAYPGCDGTESCCATRFANLVNHLGFARIPGAAANPFSAGGI